MAVTRFKLPFGKLPPQLNDAGVQQWSDYCAVTDVSSNKPAEVVIVDLVLTGLSKSKAVKVAGVSEATNKDMTDNGIDPNAKRGLPDFKKAVAMELD